MQTSWNGIKFICCREALVTVAYHDGDNKDGTPKYSIGFGSQTPKVSEGDRITVEEAFKRQRAHIADNDAVIGKLLQVIVTQHEWDAISSLYYQSGTVALRRVTALFNLGYPMEAVRAFMEFDEALDPTRQEKRRVDGLTKRRIREMILAVDGYYGDISRHLYFDGDPRATPREWREFPEP